ncbi:RDD family protein [Undibacterium terreum]|uniref:RDD family protein n=1 Tax=Undibacterium terreum TaxID=1224302 RepID=A0A916UEH2_9BURK|nr:RDD family protein [Undibacterium terreum]GGC68024.1 RDD family protein [Undibacterium terreum]
MDVTELEYVGFGPRLWASIIDTVLLTILLIAILLVWYGADSLASGLELTGWTNIFFSYVLPALIILAFWLLKGATPGKMAIGAKIVDANTGLPPTTKQHIIRYIAYYISLIPLCLGFFWVLFDKRKQGWHDKLAGTVVVRLKHRGTEPVVFPNQS